MEDIILITELWHLMNFYVCEITEIILYGNVIVHIRIHYIHNTYVTHNRAAWIQNVLILPGALSTS